MSFEESSSSSSESGRKEGFVDSLSALSDEHGDNTSNGIKSPEANDAIPYDNDLAESNGES